MVSCGRVRRERGLIALAVSYLLRERSAFRR